MGECSTYTSLQADSTVKSADWPTSWRLPGADWLSLRGPKTNSCIWHCALYDSTINIVWCIIITTMVGLVNR